MGVKITEGQIDFLGLLNEYTDEQGAKVRVREPGRSSLPVGDVKTTTRVKAVIPEKRKVVPEEPEQLRIIFDEAPSEVDKASEPVAPVIIKNEPVKEIQKDEPKAEPVKEVKNEEPKPEPVKEVQKEEPKSELVKVVQEEVKSEPVKEVQEEVKQEPAKNKPVRTKAKIPVDLTKEEKKPSTEQLFTQCKKCWCRDCKHNSRNEGVPRELCGVSMPCPACDGCVEEDMATICEIGNAKEGCMFRAVEEGIYIPDEIDEP